MTYYIPLKKPAFCIGWFFYMVLNIFYLKVNLYHYKGILLSRLIELLNINTANTEINIQFIN